MTKEESRNFWENRPCLPNESVDVFLKRHSKEFAFVFNQDLTDKKVLDLGCGSGKEAVIACLTGANVTAVDYTNIAVKLTGDLLSAYYMFDNYEVKKADIEDLPFSDGTFDFAFSLGVFHHTSNPEKAVSEVYRVLKPNGVFVMMVYNKWTRWFIKWFLGRPYEKQNWDDGCPIVRFYDKDELKKLLHKFKIDEIRGFGGFYKIRGQILITLGLDRWLGWWYVRAVKEV